MEYPLLDWYFVVFLGLGWLGLLFSLISYWRTDWFKPFTDKEKKVPWVK